MSQTLDISKPREQDVTISIIINAVVAVSDDACVGLVLRV